MTKTLHDLKVEAVADCYCEARRLGETPEAAEDTARRLAGDKSTAQIEEGLALGRTLHT